MTPDATEDVVDVAQLVAAFDAEHPALLPQEKETTLRFARDEDRLHFHTDERGIGRRLLAHPYSRIESVRVLDAGATTAASPRAVEPGAEVVGVRGSLPIGVLKIRKNPRTSGGHAAVVTKSVLEEVGGE